jgi:hypothetical protein
MSLPAPSSAQTSQAGRWWLLAMGLFLAAAGLLFTGVLWRAFERARETRSWPELPCTITSSRVLTSRPTPGSNPSHLPEIRYEFEYAGQHHTGQRVKRVDIPSTHLERVRALTLRFPVGMQTTCRVPPQAPGQAILLTGSYAPLYSIWFPLLFVLGGGMMAFRALQNKRTRS